MSQQAQPLPPKTAQILLWRKGLPSPSVMQLPEDEADKVLQDFINGRDLCIKSASGGMKGQHFFKHEDLSGFSLETQSRIQAPTADILEALRKGK